jgi:hypothetical protein
MKNISLFFKGALSILILNSSTSICFTTFDFIALTFKMHIPTAFTIKLIFTLLIAILIAYLVSYSLCKQTKFKNWIITFIGIEIVRIISYLLIPLYIGMNNSSNYYSEYFIYNSQGLASVLNTCFLFIKLPIFFGFTYYFLKMRDWV